MKPFKNSVFIFLASVFAICSCQKNQTSFTDTDKARIEEEVTKIFNKQRSYVDQMDFNAWSQCFSEEAFISAYTGVTYHPDLTVFTGNIKNYWSNRDRQQVTNNVSRIKVLSPVTVLLTGEVDFEFWLKTGESVKARDVLSTIWSKEEDGWKIIYWHESWQEID